MKTKPDVDVQGGPEVADDKLENAFMKF